MLATLLCHLAYSVGTYFLLESEIAKRWLPTATTLLDLLFAMGIAYLTEGQTGPSYVFFVFAIIAVGVRATLRAIIYVTLLGVGLYLVVIFANNRLTGAYVMRAVYLAIAGYLVGFFAQQHPLAPVRPLPAAKRQRIESTTGDRHRRDTNHETAPALDRYWLGKPGRVGRRGLRRRVRPL